MAKNDALERELEIPASEIEYIADCGSGSYGTVYRAVWKNRLVAVKIPRYRNENDGEIRHLTVLNHSNIIKFFGIAKKDEKKSLVMELSEIGSLSRILHELTDIEYSLSHVINWGLQTACGLAYLHSLKPRPMMHRDLKPQNCVTSEHYVQLIHRSHKRGSVSYMAPEVMKTESYTEKCDVYSWGVLLWEMITREKPFKDLKSFQVLLKVGARGLRLKPPEEVHQIFLKLMVSSWDDECVKRPDMKTVQEIMQQLFAMVVDENDPSRCTSLNIPNLSEKITHSNDKNSVSDLCETSLSHKQSTIDLKERHILRMASFNSIITNIDHCFFNQSDIPYTPDLDAFHFLDYCDIRRLCHSELIPVKSKSSEPKPSFKIYEDHIKEVRECIRKYCELHVLNQDNQRMILNPPRSAEHYIMLLKEEKDKLEKERQSYYEKLQPQDQVTFDPSEWEVVESDDAE